MSLLTNQTSVNKNNFFFLLANVSTLTANEVIAKNISTGTLNAGLATISTLVGQNGIFEDISCNTIEANSISSLNLETNFAEMSSMLCLDGIISSIITTNIILDGNFLDTGGAGAGATLLLNGFPIVTGAVSSFSTLSDWSYFPALSTLQMNNQNIASAGNITCQNIYNALNIQTDTFNALTAATAPTATITNLRTTNFSTVSGVGSNITVAQTLAASNISTGTISGQSGTFGGVSSLTVSTGVSRAGTAFANSFIGNLSATTISTNNLTAQTINGQPYAPSSNWSQYPANSAVNFNGFALTNNTGQTFSILPTSNLTITTSNGNLVQNYPINLTGGDIGLTANGGGDVANITTINLTAGAGNRGQINLTANAGAAGVQGEVNVTANGGSIGGVGFGGLITLTANTPIGFSNLTSAIKFSAAGINSYAGAIPSIGSLAGYNFIYGTLGVNIAAGLPSAFPNFGGTVYIYGTNGVEIPSDAYVKYITPYWDGLTTPPDLRIEGRYIIPNLAQVCVRLSNVRQIDFQSNVATYISNCDTISMSGNGTITTSNLNGTIANLTTLSNNSITATGTAPAISGYQNIGTNNLNTSFINGLPIAAYLGSNFSTFQTASISSATISSINGIGLSNLVNQTISTFQTASISSATISSINNYFSFGSTSAYTVGDPALLQLSNTTGQKGTLNLSMLQNYAEITSLNELQQPINLIFTADNFGFNTPNITGGIELDISGNTQVQGDLTVTGQIITSTITNLNEVNGKDYYTFGEFLLLSTVTVSAADTPTVIPFDTNTVGNAVSLNAGAIEVAQAGLYELKASIQFDKSGGGTDTVDFWVRVNGNDVANTASQVSVNGTQGETLGTCFYYLNLNANDLVELAFASADNTMAATYFAAWTTPGDPYDRPAIPAVIANIKLLR